MGEITTMAESYQTPGPAHTVVMGCSTHITRSVCPSATGEGNLSIGRLSWSSCRTQTVESSRADGEEEKKKMMCFTEHSAKQGNRSQHAADPHNQLIAVLSSGKWLIRWEKGKTLDLQTNVQCWWTPPISCSLTNKKLFTFESPLVLRHLSLEGERRPRHWIERFITSRRAVFIGWNGSPSGRRSPKNGCRDF